MRCCWLVSVPSNSGKLAQQTAQAVTGRGWRWRSQPEGAVLAGEEVLPE